MRRYLLTIVFHDGSHGTLRGIWPTDWDAIDAATEAFHEARRITARREGKPC